MIALVLSAALVIPRYYYLLTFDTVTRDRHACVVGTVVYKRKQQDEDWHITLMDGQHRRLVAEIIPELPLPVPDKGDRLLVCGISGLDDHHQWNEIHPVVYWRKL